MAAEQGNAADVVVGSTEVSWLKFGLLGSIFLAAVPHSDFFIRSIKHGLGLSLFRGCEAQLDIGNPPSHWFSLLRCCGLERGVAESARRDLGPLYGR